MFVVDWRVDEYPGPVWLATFLLKLSDSHYLDTCGSSSGEIRSDQLLLVTAVTATDHITVLSI